MTCQLISSGNVGVGHLPRRQQRLSGIDLRRSDPGNNRGAPTWTMAAAVATSAVILTARNFCVVAGHGRWCEFRERRSRQR
ncbi:hypothetical protein I546_5331 [Mycobacterium kansasii 732]|nr:hypothetical protein I546_5331 [Mycobacterium kansasii 732]